MSIEDEELIYALKEILEDEDTLIKPRRDLESRLETDEQTAHNE